VAHDTQTSAYRNHPLSLRRHLVLRQARGGYVFVLTLDNVHLMVYGDLAEATVMMRGEMQHRNSREKAQKAQKFEMEDRR
jgi:hypothetical protein